MRRVWQLASADEVPPSLHAVEELVPQDAAATQSFNGDHFEEYRNNSDMQRLWQLGRAEEELPSLYVNQELLPQVVPSAQSFNDCDEECHEDSKPIEFELFAEKIGPNTPSPKMDADYDVYCSTPDSDTDSDFEGDDTSESLQTELMPVLGGFLINNSVYISEDHWHTLIPIDTLVQCALCDSFIDQEERDSHSVSTKHKENLKIFPPLKKFDEAIIRKINNKYHCGVCNELFDVTDLSHFDSKTHGDNKLFAINKATDLVFDETPFNDKQNNEKHINDYYHFRTNNIINDTTTSSNSEFNDYNIFTYNNFISFRCNENEVNDNNSFDYNEEETLNPSVSYANIAKKPKVRRNKYVTVNLGTKQLQVRHDVYHMVHETKSNTYSCIVCNTKGLIRHKFGHCDDEEHLRKLEKCTVVEAYDQHYVRHFSDHCYHCGHCNNLQIISDMDDHLESCNPIKNKNVTDNTKTNTAAKNNDNNQPTLLKETKCTNTATTVTKHDKNINTINENRTPTPTPVNFANGVANKNNENIVNENNVNDKLNNQNNCIASTRPLIYGNVALYLFGHNFTLPIMSYNVLSERSDDFYCGICDFICPKDGIVSHTHQIKHVELIQMTPFLLEFHFNLIRDIRGKCHCAICNIPISPDQIYGHIKIPQHIDLLNRVLGYIPALFPVRPTSNEAHLPQNRPFMPNPAFGANNLGIISLLGINGLRPNFGAPIPPIATNAPLPWVGTNMPPTGIVNHQVPMVSNLMQYQFPPSLPAHFNIVKQNNENATTEPIKYINENKINDTQINENEINDTEINEKSSNAEDDDEEEYESDNNLNEFNKTLDSVSSEDAVFDIEEYVYLKLNNTYMKVANTAYNTLVHVGDGTRYCFVCAVHIEHYELQKHVDSRPHMENMEKCRFLEEYKSHFLRQLYLNYHCCICNVIIARKALKNHIEWPTHTTQIENIVKNIKKARKSGIKGGVKDIIVFTQKEIILLNHTETTIRFLFNGQLANGNTKKIARAASVARNNVQNNSEKSVRKNKIILFMGRALKIMWDSWHGITKTKSGYRCVLCCKDLEELEIDDHCVCEWHNYALERPFEKQYWPALIRKINDNTLNCLICNTELSNKPHLVDEHINGKKHFKNRETIWSESSTTSNYSDCNDDALVVES